MRGGKYPVGTLLPPEIEIATCTNWNIRQRNWLTIAAVLNNQKGRLGMKPHSILLASCAVFAISTVAATADCADELAAMTGGAASAGVEGGISKDGSMAPLETEAEAGAETGIGTTTTTGGATTTATTDGTTTAGRADAEASSASGDAEGGIAKDGSLAPLEEDAGTSSTEGASAGVATSAQDAQSQQDGGETAAAEAQAASDDASDTPERTAALDRAHAAMEAGDEEGCMAAVEEARGM